MVKLTSVSVTERADDAERRHETGHYFDQTIFDAHYSLQAARARSMALEADLAAMGVSVDPETGIVKIHRRMPPDDPPADDMPDA